MFVSVVMPQRAQRGRVSSLVPYASESDHGLRLDAFADKALPQRGPGLNGDGSFQLAEVKLTAKPLDPAAKDASVEAA